MSTTPPQYRFVTGLTEGDEVGLPFSFTAADGTTPENITGYALALHIAKMLPDGVTPSKTVLEVAGTLVNAALGQAMFTFATGDLSFFGKCDAEIKIVDALGAVRRIGGFGFDIRRKLR